MKRHYAVYVSDEKGVRHHVDTFYRLADAAKFGKTWFSASWVKQVDIEDVDLVSDV